MSKHTSEPWHVFGKYNHVMGNKYEDAIARGVTHSQWTHNCTPANADRIVACVNALAGLNPEAVGVVIQMLEKISDHLERISGDRDDEKIVGECRSALAKLKGSQQ